MKKEKKMKSVPFIIFMVILILVVGFVVFFYKGTPTTISVAKERGYYTNKNITLTDEYGNTIILPAGFKIASDSENAVTKGVVIEDVTETATKGSQFVWIPVTKQDGTKIKTSESDTVGSDNPLYRGLWLNDATSMSFENLTEEYKNYKLIEETKTDTGKGQYGNAIAKDIEDFCSKVKISGGFYIGRYEAASNSGTIVTKSNQEVYTNITQSNASALCQEMYKDKPFTSDLVNSYAWDTALTFIQKYGGYENYPSINASTSFAKTGENGDEILKINDMSGNASEWSTETSFTSEYPVTARGGCFENETYHDSSYRWMTVPFGKKQVSFRPILYM